MPETVATLMERIADLHKQGRKQDAARLLPALTSALMGHVTAEELGTWPICAACLGLGELNDADFEGRKLSCITNPQLCKGNQMGRMSPAQFAAFMTVELPPLDAFGEPRPVAAGPAVVAGELQPTRVPETPADATYREMAERARQGWRSPYQSP